MKSKIYLIGAGPGDPELLTIKAYRILQKADIVLYDALANPTILDLVPTWGQKIFVGKRRGYKRFEQSEINEILVKAAKSGKKTIVRLKGGDPLVFARSLEEINALQKAGFEAEIVPGISSYAAAVAENNIPLTQRHVTQSFWVLTGTTAKNQMNDELQLAAQSTATILILMGMQFLPDIVTLFKKHHAGNHPIGIMQNVTLPNTKTIFGTLDNILALKDAAGISNPAVIVIGRVLETAEQVRISSDILDNAIAI